MKRMAKVVMVAVILAALTIGQSTLMAAPIRGAETAAARSNGSGLFEHLLNLLAAVWGGGGGHAAVWGGGGGHAAVWGGGGGH